MLGELVRGELLRTHNFIAGRWLPAQAGALLDVVDPATLATIAQVADSTAVDAQAAADAAHAAFPAWRDQSGRERAQLLKRWHALILEHREDLARIISAEQGKPLAEARGEVLYGASYVEWFAEEATRTHGDIIPEPVRGRKMMAVKEPVGVVAAITPWNFPLAMIARKIAPALAAGCTVVAKPAEDTPLTAAALVELAHRAGFPAGTINLVCASREHTPEVVDAWLADPRVRKITFTGSTPVGKHLARESAGTLKKLSLELGGNAPFIVFEDADLDAAVEGLMVSKFRNGGQTCVCPNRVFVHDTVHDRFVEKLATRVGALHVGPASDERSQIGPMINQRAVDKIERHVVDAVAHGARVVTGGRRLSASDAGSAGHYYAPTVLAGANMAMVLAQEETFGPVVPVFRFSTEDEVVGLANDTPFGLAAYFYTQDAKRIWRVADQLETGIVGINEGALAAEAAPFGGVKESGYGREGSRDGLDDYMHVKYLCQGGLR
ncbi:NAD-dependent succinate-semialdehyde dehydrogenase [Hydrogenophaga sp. PBL-H3]|uniref:NAD-dependent succinate-semialdehyde dehydrogenase n=1 Tax=Hydrogenophaga sp. PBL-H3 TaxID=434010 RepID=UPI00131FB149|nr:NAD-dependent succinate-semialdehyde dehydrogenase [Hydrogenophaga sp. PBL-H3]QHE75584.1 NAD-dependent succinate-semialdehyde dehydrogenase [Hydrogenophaga sp. PBL-H3]QHE80010.1 NAD-dependent succinate-semialdehyde dehydrogenase [Hydrogenophaga sp. PBL-H3]